MSNNLTFLPSELKLWVNTPHGRGRAICVESFAHDNSIWTVILGLDGRIRHYSSTDLNACQDLTDGINVCDVKPVENKKSDKKDYIDTWNDMINLFKSYEIKYK